LVPPFQFVTSKRVFFPCRFPPTGRPPSPSLMGGFFFFPGSDGRRPPLLEGGGHCPFLLLPAEKTCFRAGETVLPKIGLFGPSLKVNYPGIQRVVFPRDLPSFKRGGPHQRCQSTWPFFGRWLPFLFMRSASLPRGPHSPRPPPLRSGVFCCCC